MAASSRSSKVEFGRESELEKKSMKARTVWRSSLNLVIPAILACAGCTAMVAGDSGTGNSSASPDATSSGSGNGAPQAGSGTNNTPASGQAVAVTVQPGKVTPESAGTLVMRRLTYREYAHILNDLLGTSDPTGGWSPDVTGDIGFIAPNSV